MLRPWSGGGAGKTRSCSKQRVPAGRNGKGGRFHLPPPLLLLLLVPALFQGGDNGGEPEKDLRDTVQIHRSSFRRWGRAPSSRGIRCNELFGFREAEPLFSMFAALVPGPLASLFLGFAGSGASLFSLDFGFAGSGFAGSRVRWFRVAVGRKAWPRLRLRRS